MTRREFVAGTAAVGVAMGCRAPILERQPFADAAGELDEQYRSIACLVCGEWLMGDT